MIRFDDDLSGQPPVALTGFDLTLADVVAVARCRRRVVLADDARGRMDRCRAMVDVLLRQSIKVYGLTTGFGKLRDVVIEREQAARLQRNLIRSHAAGVGAPFSEEVVRAALLLRANTLCRGNSGIRSEVVHNLVEILNSDVYPYVPQQGSVGASGDLAPLSHLALVAIGDPEGRYLPWTGPAGGPARVAPAHAFVGMPGDADFDAVAAAQGWRFRPVTLDAKEGLALNNGTQFMAAMGCLALHDATFALRHSELACALSLEANFGVRDAYDPRIHAARPQPHQPDVARRLRAYGQGSEILDLWLNSACLATAVLKLEEASERLSALTERLDHSASPLQPRVLVTQEAICALVGRIRALTPPPGTPAHGRLEAWRQLTPRAQIAALGAYLTRPRQDSTAILRELQATAFPAGPERDQARAAVVAAVKALDDAVPDTPPVQDDYSFRCAPQVLACAWRVLGEVETVLAVEINAATDNPLLFPPNPADDGGPALESLSAAAYADWLAADPDRIDACARSVVGGGNFHGEPLAIALDTLKIAMAEVASISERRVAHLTDPNHSAGLPAFLVADSGLHSGYMIPQYTAAALVSENKVLCHPSSVDSVPTCANTEDHVSMGTTAARHALTVVDNVEKVVAIELLTAVQGLGFREPLRPGLRLREAVAWLLSPEGGDLPRLDVDAVHHPRLQRMQELLHHPELRAFLLAD